MTSIHHFFSRKTHIRYPLVGALGALLLTLFINLSTPSFAFAATRSPLSPNRPASCGCVGFVQTTTSSNTHGDYTIIDHEFPNGVSNAVVLASPALDLSNLWNAFSFDPRVIGVEYNNQLQRWLIVNEDGSPMPVGARFNVEAFANTPQQGDFSIPTDSVNLIHNDSQVIIDNPVSNNNSHALILVTDQIYQPNPNRDTHSLGTSYDSNTGKWVLFHEDGTPMTPGETYDFIVEPSAFNENIQTVSTNTYGLLACVNNSAFNNNPAAAPIVSVRGTATVTGPIAMLYNPLNSEWCAFGTTIAPLPSNAQFVLSYLSM